MKTRRNIYYTIGIVLIILNLLTDLISLSEYNSKDTGYSIGYFIGSHVLMLIGIVLCRMAYKINRSLKNTNPDNLENEIEKIGSN